MYPILNITDTFSVHTFGICLIVSWVLFFSLLHIFSLKKGIVQHIFSDILGFTLTPFLVGRLFHILAEWREEKFIFMDLVEGGGFFHFLARFFLTEDYNLSLAGGILGFLLVFWFKTRKNKKDRPLYYEIMVPAFLISALLGYFGAYLGGQIYGIPYEGPLGIAYDTKNTIVPYSNELFPLPFLYIFSLILILIYLWKIMKKGTRLPDGFIGYLGMGLFGIVVFLSEFLNGSSDMLSSTLHINFNQAIGLYLIVLAFIGLGKSLKIELLS